METQDLLPALSERVAQALVRLDVAKLEKEATNLEQETLKPDFWSDQHAAQSAMRRLAQLNEIVNTWRTLEKRVDEARELFELALAESDVEMLAHVAQEAEAVEKELDTRELALAFGGPYDARSAVLAIHAGAGGTESQDWAEMLLRMYLRWCETHNYESEVLDSTLGEEAGVKSVTIEVKGPSAYGYLKSERGVHRLVRLSPFDSAHARHTSFALVEVMPEAEGEVELDIKPEDLKIDIYHSAGHGGQNVQKVATAVRITHLPTGIVVTCQNERSQGRNKELAMRVLEARLLEKQVEKRAEEQAKIKGEHIEAGWGNQIRSYVLHPYRMVKDHRTDYETSNANAVLDGDLDGFIQAYLKSRMGSAV
ncbi:MAG: peptide chain release factor 2 [Dehalococcoidia bacterium]|nr:peptide chain release factor 2 [Dehalococcoidia bacterium]